MCFPKGRFAVERRRSDARPMLVRYRDPEDIPYDPVKAKLLFDVPARRFGNCFRTPKRPKARLVEIEPRPIARPVCDLCRCPLELGREPEVPRHCKPVHICAGCQDDAVDPMMMPAEAKWFKNGHEDMHARPRRKSVCSSDGETESLLRDFLRHLNGIFGKEERRDRELERLKRQLKEEIRKSPGEIQPLLGYEAKERYAQEHPAVHHMAAPPPSTPVVWQFPYGARVPDFAIAEAKANRKQHRRRIAEYNARAFQNHDNRRRHSARYFRRRSDFSETVKSESISSDGTLVDEVARDRAEQAVRRTEKLQRQMNDIEFDLIERNRRVMEHIDKVKATERRIRQSPDLASSGLHITLDTDRQLIAEMNQQLRANNETIMFLHQKQQEINLALNDFDSKLKNKADKSVAHHLDKLGLSYGEMESRLDRNLARERNRTDKLDNQMKRLKDDVDCIRDKLQAQEHFDEINKLHREADEGPDHRSPYDKRRRDWVCA